MPIDKLMQPRLADQLPKRRQLISLTPLIDVVFILLVFFMLASNFLEWQSVLLDTASLGESPSVGAISPPILRISEQGLELNGRSVSYAELNNRLRALLQANAEEVVVVQPTGNTSIQSVLKVIDQLNSDYPVKASLVPDPAWNQLP